jgi:hypothetical protein
MIPILNTTSRTEIVFLEGFWTGLKQRKRIPMKIRADYVSNSSSSSYVIALPKGHDMYDFINKAVKACSDFRDDDTYDDDDIRELNLFNHRQLDFCMNSYELLFIGELQVGWIPGTVDGEKEVEDFIKSVNHMKNDNYPYTPRILSQTKDHLEYEDVDVTENVTINSESMSCVRPYKWKKDDDDNYRKKVVDSILKVASRNNRDNPFFREDCMGICEITMNTILNTQDLIAEEKEIKLPEWGKDLESLKKRIEDGDRIFCIELNQGGDGQNIGSIYALNGWDSDFNKYTNVEVIGSWL